MKTCSITFEKLSEILEEEANYNEMSIKRIFSLILMNISIYSLNLYLITPLYTILFYYYLN